MSQKVIRNKNTKKSKKSNSSSKLSLLIAQPNKKIKPRKNQNQNCYCFSDHPEFTPNLSPLEVLQQGAFGGTYFRPIKSGITNQNYHSRHERYFTPQQLKKCKISIETMLTRPYEQYDKSVNKYKTRCGQTLEEWENKDWITHHDPYGWFEWYCNFFQGRRIPEEDARQIKRWLSFCGPKGRFSQRLKNMVRQQKKKPEDPIVSPRIRQTLLHWGYELTPHNF